MMNESLLPTIEQLARESVHDVFRRMLELPLSETTPAAVVPDPAGQIVGSVGFVGDVNGIVHLHAGQTFARLITGRMLGVEAAAVQDDEMVNDAIGELGNVVVGNLKSRLCDRGHSCALTLPSIIRGEQLCPADTRTTSSRRMIFRHDDHTVMVDVVLPDTAGARPAAERPRPKILTVDDSKLVRLRVGKALASCDCVLLEAANGEDALKLARGEKPDLILLDYTMPVMDGLETMTAMRADALLEAVPVIMLTAEGSRTIMAQMAALGVRDYLLKPFQDHVLLERVRRVLGLDATTATEVERN